MSFETFKAEAKKIEGTYDEHLESIRSALQATNFSDAQEAHLLEKLTINADSVGGVREALIHTARDPLAMFILSTNMGGLRNDEKMLKFYGFTISATKAIYENLRLLLQNKAEFQHEKDLKNEFLTSSNMEDARQRVDFVLDKFLPGMENVICAELEINPEVIAEIINQEDLQFMAGEELNNLQGVQGMSRINFQDWKALNTGNNQNNDFDLKQP